MSFIRAFVTIVLLASGLLASQQGLAWGERGHDLITRVAVQNLRTLTSDNPNAVRPFLSRDHMLAHLSNVPDIVWRAPYMSQTDRDVNYSTHYINLERVYLNVSKWQDVPAKLAQYRADASNKGLSPEEVGTAPWRALEMYQRLVAALKQAGEASTEAELEDRTNQALLYAGIMSHFVGDLANPHHTTANYDGQLTGQRGLHAYFESDIVAEQPLDLALKVQQYVQTDWLANYSDRQRLEIKSDPQALIWALLANSHRHLPELLALDANVSLLKRSAGDNQRAERKPPKEAAEQYQRFVVQRLAVGASALSRLWLLAWQQAGSPDLSAYRSYVYPVQPDFIDPDYLRKEVAASDDEWRDVDPDRVLVMQLTEGRVVIELAPEFAPEHVKNILLLSNENYFDNTAIIRVQENYVVQWGDTADVGDKAKSLGSAKEKLDVEYFADPQEVGFVPIESRDAYAEQVGFTNGFPTASDGKRAWLAHCYGMVGVSRGMESNSGNGSGLYVVSGHAPRHLDRNVTLVGRVLEGMEHLTTLPRGTGDLGFYESPDQYIPINSVSVASELPPGSVDLQIMRTESPAFKRHVAARTTRNEAWFMEPTGRIELCNVAVPMRQGSD